MAFLLCLSLVSPIAFISPPLHWSHRLSSSLPPLSPCLICASHLPPYCNVLSSSQDQHILPLLRVAVIDAVQHSVAPDSSNIRKSRMHQIQMRVASIQNARRTR
ncbi:hypothetical protein BC827DRAFT_178492 [Russula dissimulans]|nr:hypothetical protein BC827DRAFT_178492 [Russula dissimulans]